MNIVQREQLVDGLFHILNASGADTIYDLKSGKRIKAALAMISSIKQIDPATKHILSQTLGKLVGLIKKNTPLLLAKNSAGQKQ